MILFGWGKTMTKNFGPIKKCQCGRCNNVSEWSLLRVSTWFTLYFIPVFPYSTKRLLVCPVCGSYVELSKDEFEEFRSAVNVNAGDRNTAAVGLELSDSEGQIKKTQTQLNYIREMEEFERDRQERLKNNESL